MGLDITAYQGIKLIDTCDVDDFEEKHDWETTCHVWPGYADGTHYPEQLAGGNIVPDGVYEYEEKFGFRAASYSWYNQWREILSMLFIGVIPACVWASPGNYKEHPFYYIVNFSDCEGVIAGAAAKKLANDFETFSTRAHQHPDDWFIRIYDDFHKAFRMAASNGFVDFH